MQKLVVVKNLQTGSMGSYVVSIIPDKSYAESNRRVSAMDFTNYGDYGRFSGRIVYSLPLSSIPLRVNRYCDGVMVDAVSLFGLQKDSPELQAVYAKMNNLLDGLWLKRKFRVALRSNELDGGWLDEVVVTPGDQGGDYWDNFWDNFWDDFWDDYNNNGENEGDTDTNPPDPGNTGGGGASASGTPKAKKIFRNSNMSEYNWRKIEEMIEKIQEYCLGGELYSELEILLNGRTLTIQFNDGPGSSFSFNGTTAGISLSTSMESNQLFHEMWHAYQAYQETAPTFAASELNLEIEARYAQYLYLRNLPEYSGSQQEDWYKQDPLCASIAELEEYVSPKGDLAQESTNYLLEYYISIRLLPRLKSSNPAYSNKSYDENRWGVNNFNNLNNLSINC
jgi:hypothetical protein